MSSVDDAATPETELKFEIGAPALAKLRKHPAFATPPEVAQLRSVYFDTPDHDLRNAGVSLRVREKAGAFVQTVKTRGGPGAIARHEWEADVAADRPDAGALAKTPAGDVLNGAGTDDLAPVFATSVQRAVRLWTEAGSVVEMSLDEGEINAGSDREPIRELELELKTGAPAALFSLAHDLAKTVPMRLSFDSKAERGYRLAGHDTTAALKAEQASLSADVSAAEAFRQIARSCLTQIGGNAQLLRRVRSPQALHQARVGLRRLRAALSAFKSVVEDGEFGRIKAEAKWLAQEFDEARDLDVFIHTSVEADEEDLHGDAALGAFYKRLLAAQAKAYDRATAAVESARFAALLLDTAAWMEVGEWSVDADPQRSTLRTRAIGDFGAEALEALDRKVRKAGRDLDRLLPEERHKLRIKGKKLRYAADFFSESFPGRPKRRKRYVAALKAMQDRLGELNDIAVAGDVALEVAGRRAGEAAFAAGLLVGRRRQDEPALLRAAKDAFEDFTRSKRFWPKPAV